MTPPLCQKAKRNESLLMKVKEGKSWLKTQHSKNEDHGIWSHHFMGNRCGNSGNSDSFLFLDSEITADPDCNHETKDACSLEEKL